MSLIDTIDGVLMLGVPVIDGLLAATALTNGLTLVTRNDRDTAGLGATVLNPFRSDGDRRG
jgi:predicted nucleic acid-binding protein